MGRDTIPPDLARRMHGRQYSRAVAGAALLGFFSLLTLINPSAAVGGLRDTVTNLYGGDGITLAPPTMGRPHVAHFNASSLQGLDALNEALAPNLNNLALNSTVTGFTFDIERGVPVRSTESLGPLLAERATTIGAKKLNVVFSFTRLDFTTFEGRGLDEQSLTFIHGDVCPTGGDGKLGPPPGFCDFELDQIRVGLDLEIEQDVFALIATYGVTRYWDVGIVLPIVHTRIDVVANATVIDNSPPPAANPHIFDPAAGGDARISTGGGDATGLGDLIIRSKYNFLRKHSVWPDLAIRGDIKFETGDEDDLLGTGDTRFQGLLIASKTVGPVTPHVNFGGQVSDSDSNQNNVRYIAGFDTSPNPHLTFALDVLGQWQPSGDDIGDHIVDLAPQVKWNVFGTFVINGFVLLPLNKNEGLRTDYTWSVGTEYFF